jgi:hypothetical protein
MTRYKIVPIYVSACCLFHISLQKVQTPHPLVCNRTTVTERSLVGEVSAYLGELEECPVVSATGPHGQ